MALSLAVGLIGLVGPSAASAATTVGATFPPTTLNCDSTYLAADPPSGLYAVPSPGVITSWSFQAGAAVAPLRLKLGRAEGPLGTFTIVGQSDFATPVANQLNTFPTRITVSAGDLLGLYATSSIPCGQNTGGAGVWTGGPADQQPGTSSGTYTPGPGSLDVSAVLEPDADNDGFGDETQDNCPTAANPAQDDGDGDGLGTACDDEVSPSATITKGPKAKTKKKTATFTFSGSDARVVASFQCSLDGAPFASCTSPHTVKVKKGKHTFQARAVDQAGNVGSPATFDWKVKKKKKK
jgi:hypothetical protein